MSQVGRAAWLVCGTSRLRGTRRCSCLIVTARRAHALARERDQGLGSDVQREKKVLHERDAKEKDTWKAIPRSPASSTKNPMVAGTCRSSIVAVQSTSIFGPTDDMATLNSFSVNTKYGNRMATLSRGRSTNCRCMRTLTCDARRIG